MSRYLKLGALKEALFDAEQRAREAGGIHAGAALLGLEPVEPNVRPQIESLWGDLGPDATPARLPAADGEAEPERPATTAFSLQDLLESLYEAEDALPLTDSGDLTRWLCGVTE